MGLKSDVFMDKERMKILLVEHDTGSRRFVEDLLAEYLQPIEFVVETAVSLSTAIKCLNNNTYDIALIDIKLPDCTWEEMLRKVIEIEPNIPIVALTELQDEEKGFLAIRNGATDFLVKSQFSEESLVHTIRCALERKSIEGKMKYAAQQWRTTFDSISDMVSIHDTNFKIVRVNKAFAEAFHTEPKKIIGKSCYEVLHNKKQPCSTCPHRLTLKTKKAQASDFFEPNMGIHLGVSTFPIFDEEDKTIGVVHIAKDISVRKLAEENLRKANEKLKEYNELKDEFIATVSHELRTPLSIIQSAITLVLDEIMGKIVDEQRETLTMALDGAKWLTEIITSLLNLSKIETGNMVLQKKIVNISTIIEEVVSEYKPLAQEKVLSLDYALPEYNIDICLDPDKIRECLGHLVSNSIKFTPEGGAIRVTCTKKEEEVQFGVQDSGVGISKNDLMRLFDKFTQFNRKAGSGANGTGLGLAITKKLVEMHDGRINVESEVDQGTTFTVSLPLTSIIEKNAVVCQME